MRFYHRAIDRFANDDDDANDGDGEDLIGMNYALDFGYLYHLRSIDGGFDADTY